MGLNLDANDYKLDGLKLLGGRTCLDFANTVENRNSPSDALDLLQTYSDFIRWCERTGVVSRDQAEALLAVAAREKSAAMQALADALELREIIHRIFSARAGGRDPSDEDMRRFNAFHARAMAASRISRTANAYAVRFDAVSGSFDLPLNPIVWSAAQLLMGDGLDRVKICSDDCCGWLFVDESKNKSRRWCDMSDCGNRAKAKRHYHRRTMKDGNAQPAVAHRIKKTAREGRSQAVTEDSIRLPSEPEMEIGSDD
jgi:predicted RNA-binding Zn ribbon-like protein